MTIIDREHVGQTKPKPGDWIRSVNAGKVRFDRVPHPNEITHRASTAAEASSPARVHP